MDVTKMIASTDKEDVSIHKSPEEIKEDAKKQLYYNKAQLASKIQNEHYKKTSQPYKNYPPDIPDEYKHKNIEEEEAQETFSTEEKKNN